MARKKIISRMERLEELTGILKSDHHHTAASLAEQLSISTRTLLRDLDVLKDKGYPIETDQGRGGGIRLHRNWGVGRLQLNYREVIDLLLSLAIMEKVGSILFLDNVKAIRNKISVSFPPEQRENVQSLRKRILISNSTSFRANEDNPISSSEIYNIFCDAFFEQKKLHISYQNERKEQTERVIEAHYLFMHWPIWYVLAWDHLRQDIRCFRLDRIIDAKLENETFQLKKKGLFTPEIESFSSNL